MCDQDPMLLENIVMGDETWCYQFNPESKRQSMAWCSLTFPRPKKICLQNSKVKTLLIVFFDNKGILSKEFVPASQTINAAFYQAVLNQLLQCICRVWPVLHRTWKWMLHHDNTTAHNAICMCQFLAQKMIAVLDHPPYSPDLAPVDFFLFPHLKAAIKGARFAECNQRLCDSCFAIDFIEVLCWLFPEAVRTLSNVCCSGWQLFWRAIKKICLYLLFSDRIHRIF